MDYASRIPELQSTIQGYIALNTKFEIL
jgi:hypothetical protein